MLPDALADNPVVFEGYRFKLRTVELDRAGGGTLTRQVIDCPDSVCVLPLLDDTPGSEQVVMIRNQRFAAGQRLWELPAGTMETGEDPAICAARELAEEAGHKAVSLTLLTQFYPSPGFSTEFMSAFLATGLTAVGQSLDDTERITTEVVPLSQTMQMMQAGEIRDGKTIATLLFYAALHQSRPDATDED